MRHRIIVVVAFVAFVVVGKIKVEDEGERLEK